MWGTLSDTDYRSFICFYRKSIIILRRSSDNRIVIALHSLRCRLTNPCTEDIKIIVSNKRYHPMFKLIPQPLMAGCLTKNRFTIECTRWLMTNNEFKCSLSSKNTYRDCRTLRLRWPAGWWESYTELTYNWICAPPADQRQNLELWR